MVKYCLLLLCIVFIMPASLLSCAPATGEAVTVSVTCDQFSKQKAITNDMDVRVGNTISVNLCSNRTTGFSWSEQARISDPQVLEQTGHDFIAPAKDTKMVGVPGTEVWTFKALKPGKSSIYMEYSQPWQGGQKAAWTYGLNVLVK